MYSLDTQLAFALKTDESVRASLVKAAPFAPTSIREDSASIILEEDGKRYRIPRGAKGIPAQSGGRVCREVATERDLLNVGGTFFELPARNAQGLAKMRPIATHLLEIDDYASQFGLTFLASTSSLKSAPNADSKPPVNPTHQLTLPDESASLWAGVIDDLWKLGKPRGIGGPWHETTVESGVPSDPYLMSGYDHKTLTLSHSASFEATMTIEVDVDGTGVWLPYRAFKVTKTPVEHTFPDGFGAYWIRVKSDTAAIATAQLVYE
jgi:hypothetical protein